MKKQPTPQGRGTPAIPPEVIAACRGNVEALKGIPNELFDDIITDELIRPLSNIIRDPFRQQKFLKDMTDKITGIKNESPYLIIDNPNYTPRCS